MATKTNTTQAPSIQETCATLSSTSAKIRYLSGTGMTTGAIEKALKAYGVTTKNGDPIRYQHVRNVLMTKLTTK
jgi:hypothetical protein